MSGIIERYGTALAGMLLFAAARRMLRAPAKPEPRMDSVIDGEYSVVDKRPATLSLQ